MQVENIECQIAQAQIGHFLAGSGLSEEAMRQLEDHIAGCPECKSALNERRSELRAMLTGQKPAIDFEAIAREAENTKTKSISASLRKKTLQQMLEPPAELPSVHEQKAVVEVPAPVAEQPKTKPAKSAKPTNHWKPLGLSLGLAAVLICMSLFSKNIAAIFGPKLSEVETAAKVEPPKTDVPKTDTPKTETVGTTLVAGTSAASDSATTPGTDLASDQTVPSVTGEGVPAVNPTTEPVTEPKTEEAPVEPESTSGATLGASAGALATTQFEATDEPVVPTPVVAQPPVTKPVTKPAIKPTVKAAKRVSPRRVVRRKPIRRVAARRPARGVRSRGIKVYNP